MRISGTVAAATLVACLLVCSVATAPAAASASDPDPAVAEWPTWPYRTACYGPPFDPVRVFSSPADAELGSAPAERALAAAIKNPALAGVGMSRRNWRRVSESRTQAVFVSGELSSPLGPWWALFEREGRAWKWHGSGTCVPRTVLRGLRAVSWTLDRSRRMPGRNARRVWVDLGPGPCASGMSQNARAYRPIFRQLGRRLLMTILLEPLPPGPYNCEGIVEPPLAVKLPGRLGKRRLFDGGTYPPGDVVETWREGEARQRAAPR